MFTMRFTMSIRATVSCAFIIICQTWVVAESPREQRLTDIQYRFLVAQPGWGQLGINCAAHLRNQKGTPLKIGNREYPYGLGHHAPGEIVIDLGGEYASFESDVGVQNQGLAAVGSVIFKVFVDDELRFESGVMKSDSPARKISVPVEGGEELRLVVTDAGDGLTSDMADWANARLVRVSTPVASKHSELLDVALFAQVVTSDPARTDGARANRIQEYRAEDMYLETPATADAKGVYNVVAAAGKPACIGLKWIERRRLREIGFELAEGATAPKADAVQLQCWVGQSAFQGNWKPVGGEWKLQGAAWTMRPDWSSVPGVHLGTRKIRIISTDSLAIRRFTALTVTPIVESRLQVQIEKAPADGKASIEFYNAVRTGGDNPLHVDWAISNPLDLTVRYSKLRSWAADKPVLRFKLPTGEFGVAVEDVLKNGCVYVRDFGLFITRDPALTIEQYKQKIAGKQTILQQVRGMPDQTLAQAVEHVHHPAQNLPPTLLSLACDNHKFILHRDGSMLFSSAPEDDDKFVQNKPTLMDHMSASMTPTLGSGKTDKMTRRLAGDWMPIVINELEQDQVAYRQRTFVAPWGKNGTSAVCVVEIVAVNNGNAPAQAVVKLAFNAKKDDAAEMMAVPAGAVAFRRGRLVAAVKADQAAPLKLDVVGNGTLLTGQLPPRVTSRIFVFIPTTTMKPEQHVQFSNGDELQRATRDYWQKQLAPAMQVEVPDKLLANTIKASQVHCLIAARSEENGSRVSPWIASVSYGPLESESNSIIRGMDFFGHHDFVRKSLDFFIRRYSPEGFLTTGYTMMGNGWHLWMLGEHYGLAKDKEWLTKVAPEVSRLCKWIVRQREKSMKTWPDGSKPTEYGFVPPGVMADWDSFAYYFCLNGYYCAGLRSTAEALVDAGIKEAAGWRDMYHPFREDILRGYAWTRARMPVYPLRDGTSVPAYPSQLHGLGATQLFFPGEDSSRSWCYDIELGSHHMVPQGLLDPNSREVGWMMDHMEDVQFLAEGWFDFSAESNQKDWYNKGGFSKVQPYYSRNVEVCAMRDDVKPFIRSYFNTIPSLLNMENLSFQEHFHGAGAWNKTHETGYFLHQTRLMMVQERGDDLWLAPFVTYNWLKNGMSVAATNAPTRFGPVSYRITSAVGQGNIDATIDPPTRSAPAHIVLRLRHPDGKRIQKVTVNGQPHEDFDPAKDTIRITPATGKIAVRASY